MKLSQKYVIMLKNERKSDFSVMRIYHTSIQATRLTLPRGPLQ